MERETREIIKSTVTKLKNLPDEQISNTSDDILTFAKRQTSHPVINVLCLRISRSLFSKRSDRKGGTKKLTVATRITVPPLCLPRRGSYSSGSFSVYSVDAKTSRDAPVRIRRGCLTGRGDTSELLVKGVQLGRNVLTDEGVEDDLEQGPMPEYPEQLQPGPTDVRARLLRSNRHLEDVVDVLVHGLPFRRVDELISFDVMQVCSVAGHLQPELHRTIR